MLFNKICIRGIVVASLSLLAISAHAWDGVQLGTIATVDVAPGDNYGFRVSLDGGATLCGNANTWAYLNEADSNYKTFVGVLMAAKLAGKSVVIYANREMTSGQGYCHIGYVSLR